MTSQQIVSSAHPLPAYFPMSSTHKATKTARDSPVITRSCYFPSWGPCHRRKNTFRFLIHSKKKSVTVHRHCSASHTDSEHYGHDTTHMYKCLTCSPDPHLTMGISFILIMEQWCTCLSCQIRGRRRGRLFWQWRSTPGDVSVRTDQELLCAEHRQFQLALQWIHCGSQVSP